MKTIVGLYDDFTTAQRVVEALADAGFDRNNISLVANDATGEYATHIDTDTGVGSGAGVGAGIGAVLGGIGGLLVGLGALAIPGIGPVIAAGPLIAALTGAGIGAVAGGLVGALVDMGIPEEEAEYYAEGVRRGGTLVTVTAADDMADRAADIMENYNPVNVEQRASEWQQGGWTGFDSNATPYTHEDLTRDRSRYGRADTLDDDDTLEVVEEELAVGKRTIDRGGVRVRSYVTERPVEESVRLREETVDVHRRPVDRPASEADLNAFEEGTIEVTAIAEEPVVSKRARVVEEVVVDKDVHERTETVRDTVRRKDVEVEDLGTTRTGTASTFTDDFATYDADFRNDYNTRYANSGYTYDQYVPAYRYGYSLAHHEPYRGRSWNEIEPMARRSWEERNQGTWENFKDAVRRGWENVKDAVDMN